MYLPRATGLGQTVAEALVSANVEGGTEVVLVVEDDLMVRRYVMTQIQGLGYTALEAANGRGSPDHYRREPRPSNLLFTDVIMPGAMNGRQLVEEASKRRPSLKVLYTSGYTENAIVHHGRLDTGVLLLYQTLSQVRTGQDAPAGACQLKHFARLIYRLRKARLDGPVDRRS